MITSSGLSENQDTQERKNKFMTKKLAILLLGLLCISNICGCGKVSGGDISVTSSADAERKVSAYNEETQVRWYDGVNMQIANVVVTTPISGTSATKMLTRVDSDKIPKVEGTQHITMLRVTPDNDGAIPVSAKNSDGTRLSYNGIEYDGSGYYVGDGWYVVLVPNGKTDIMYSVGTSDFAEDTAKTDETVDGAIISTSDSEEQDNE